MIATDYAVQIVLIDAVTPSPENDEIYGSVTNDPQMETLIESIRRRGLEEPIIKNGKGAVRRG